MALCAIFVSSGALKTFYYRNLSLCPCLKNLEVSCEIKRHNTAFYMKKLVRIFFQKEKLDEGVRLA